MYCSRIVRSLIRTRCLSLTSIQSMSTTKLNEKKIVKDDETSSQDPMSKAKMTSEGGRAYSEQIRRIVDEISRLSLVEVMDLNELLKKKLKIQDVPIVASGGGAIRPPPTATKKEEAEEEEGTRPNAQSVFKVRLIKFDETKKVPVIKQVKDIVENINLVQAKKLVESVPQVLRDNLSKADAETMKAKIEAAGGICAIE